MVWAYPSSWFSPSLHFALPLLQDIMKKAFTNSNSHHTVTHQFDKSYSDGYFVVYGDVPSELSFIVFVSVWTMVVTIYLLVAPLKFPRLAPVIAVLALDALTMLFWFAAFIALAVWKSNLDFCFGRICNTIIAGIVFGAFEWSVFFFLSSHTPYPFVMESVAFFFFNLIWLC